MREQSRSTASERNYTVIMILICPLQLCLPRCETTYPRKHQKLRSGRDGPAPTLKFLGITGIPQRGSRPPDSSDTLMCTQPQVSGAPLPFAIVRFKMRQRTRAFGPVGLTGTERSSPRRMQLMDHGPSSSALDFASC